MNEWTLYKDSFPFDGNLLKKMKWNQNDKNIKYLVRTKNNDENKGEEEKLSW